METLRDESPFLCLKSPGYLAGICGLLAGKLTERFGRPSLVAHQQGELCVASLRSIPAYDVADGLASVSDLLLHFGGHAMAAGCAFKTADFAALRERLCADVARRVPSEDLVPVLEADVALDMRHLTLPLCEKLSVLEPFGQGNPEPTFLLERVQLRDARAVGKTGDHLQARAGGAKLIAFGMGGFLDAAASPVDLVCHLGVDAWQGSRTVQLMVQDLRASVPVTAGVFA